MIDNTELQKKFEDLSRQFDEYKKDVERKLSGVQDRFGQHTHGGTDSSTFIYNDSIHLKPGQQFATGNFAIAEQTASPGEGQAVVQRGFLVIGDDQNFADGLQNAQITFEHQPDTNGSTNQSFVYGFRSPLYIGADGTVTSGGTTLQTDAYDFPANSLVGAFLIVTDPSTGNVEGYEIASHTSDTITITGGTFGFSAGDKTYFVIFMPIYWGSADFPWRRIYTMAETDGGVRFGLGSTNGGQNGLLYMLESDGVLYWRNPAGVSTPLTGFTNLGDDEELIISGGVITPTGGFHRVDTEGAAATDDLDTVDGSSVPDGTILVLRASSSSRTVVCKDDAGGNMRLAGDCTLDHSEDTLTLIWTGTLWLELSRSDNG